ncbi:MAG: hypothetical protein PHF05_09025 [Candidatus Izemoplasmatales bacterium]|nr:hypothetical protein [Candidatus Izemoplasmatales bacterium]
MSSIVGLQKTEEKIKLHFEGSRGIEIETLIASLEYTKTTLKASKNNIPGVQEYEILVEPFKEGSFVVDITLLVYAATELLPSVVSIGTVFLETLKIWKVLKGQPAKQVMRNQTNNTVEITGDNNNVIVVSPEALGTAMDSKKIAEDISNVAKKLLKDTTDRGLLNITLEKHGHKETVTYNYEDIKEIKSPVYLKESLSDKSITISHIILKPNIVNFDKIDDWKFTSSLSDKPFKAKIEDSEFRRRVLDGEITFGSETRIKVILQTVETELKDGTGKKTYEHTIIKVEDIIDHDIGDQIKADI